jgi:uncharacterized ferritin-like protein (DUF455 family)
MTTGHLDSDRSARSSPAEREAPPEHTLEGWAFAYLTATTLEGKRALGPWPDAFEPDAPARRSLRPARPPPLRVVNRAEKIATHPEALRDPRRRAAMLHAFAHHELQAAELYAWALLAWPAAPTPFRLGLAKIARDEVRHMDLYLSRVEALGARWGAFDVRDWFWQRLGDAPGPAHFVATMGLGFEGANLDHVARFVALLEAAGDPESAELVRRVGDEERSHVAFAATWLERLTGACTPEVWRAHLVEPLSPLVMRGPSINFEARARARMPDALVRAIAEYDPRGDDRRASR